MDGRSNAQDSAIDVNVLKRRIVEDHQELGGHSYLLTDASLDGDTKRSKTLMDPYHPIMKAQSVSNNRIDTSVGRASKIEERAESLLDANYLNANLKRQVDSVKGIMGVSNMVAHDPLIVDESSKIETSKMKAKSLFLKFASNSKITSKSPTIGTEDMNGVSYMDAVNISSDGKTDTKSNKNIISKSKEQAIRLNSEADALKIIYRSPTKGTKVSFGGSYMDAENSSSDGETDVKTGSKVGGSLEDADSEINNLSKVMNVLTLGVREANSVRDPYKYIYDTAAGCNICNSLSVFVKGSIKMIPDNEVSITGWNTSHGAAIALGIGRLKYFDMEAYYSDSSIENILGEPA